MTTPVKFCCVCGREMAYRRRWARAYAQVRYCSERCRRQGLGEADYRAEIAVLELLSARPACASISPSEVARSLAAERGLAKWDDLMEPVRCAARRLVVRNEVVITQGGQVVDPSRARGPMLIRRA